MSACVTCGHDDPHNAAGIGVCRALRCGCDGPMTAPVPRPAEEPDREALIAALNVLWRNKGWTQPTLGEIADAVLALLPTPPAPGGGGTDLRGDEAGVAAALTALHRYDCWDEDTHDTCKHIARVCAEAALAARDADQRAGDALAQVERLADAWAAIPPYRATDYDRGRVEQRQMCEEELRAALARATPEAEEGT